MVTERGAPKLVWTSLTDYAAIEAAIAAPHGNVAAVLADAGLDVTGLSRVRAHWTAAFAARRELWLLYGDLLSQARAEGGGASRTPASNLAKTAPMLPSSGGGGTAPGGDAVPGRGLDWDAVLSEFRKGLEAAPAAAAGPAPDAETLALERYARMRAEMLSAPGDGERIRARYGVASLEAQGAIDRYWAGRFAGDDALRAKAQAVIDWHLEARHRGDSGQRR